MKTFYHYGKQLQDNSHIIAIHDEDMLKDLLDKPHQPINRGDTAVEGLPVLSYYVIVSDSVYQPLADKWKPVPDKNNEREELLWNLFKQ